MGFSTSKGSRFGGTLPDSHSSTDHTTPDKDSQISPNRLSRQPALCPTDFRLLTLTEVRFSDLTFVLREPSKASV